MRGETLLFCVNQYLDSVYNIHIGLLAGFFQGLHLERHFFLSKLHTFIYLAAIFKENLFDMKFHDVHFTPLSLMARKGHFDTYYVP